MMLPLSEARDMIEPHFRNMEFIFSNKCQKACTYCYRTRYQNEGPMFPMTPQDMERYIGIAKKYNLLEFPTHFELFGGDPILDLPTTTEYLKAIAPHAHSIILPTNGLILENIHDESIDDLVESSERKVFFSFSVDGPAEHLNRPLSTFGKMMGFKQERNWSRLFHISEKYGGGFHPMLSFDTTNLWFEQWDFFRKNVQTLYLLEVRHPIKDHLVMLEGIYQLAKIILTARKESIPNTFNTTQFMIVDRGMTCSALTSLQVHFDGKAYFCHRLLQPKYELFDFNKEEVDVRKFHLLNTGWHHSNSATCMKCPIRKACPGQCQGAIDEYWEGAIGTPIPSVCQYYLLKYYILSKLDESWHHPEIIDYTYLYKVLRESFGCKMDTYVEDIERRLIADALF